MKKGDRIGEYVLTTDPQNGGGHSEWAFARKDGEDFFIKRFLQPTYPVDGVPGSEKTKAHKRARCEEFERHQRLVKSKLRPLSGEGGNLVVTKDFFRERAFYYKVTAKVAVSNIGPAQIAAMPRDHRILIMLTAAKSLDTLHKAGLVHGDVKPENLLIKELGGGSFAVKVIDFDNCFPVQHPPPAHALVGDPAYYSPELLLYNLDKLPGSRLTEKNDVFALGLVFWQYITGRRPALPAKAGYPADAVHAGTALTMPRAVKDRALADLVDRMLDADPGNRPSMSEVHSGLRLARRHGREEKPAPEPRTRDKPVKPVLRGFPKRLRPGAAGFAPGGDSELAAARPPAEVPPPLEPDARDAEPAGGADGLKIGGTLARKLARRGGKAPAAEPAEERAPGEAIEGELRGTLLKRKK